MPSVRLTAKVILAGIVLCIIAGIAFGLRQTARFGSSVVIPTSRDNHTSDASNAVLLPGSARVVVPQSQPLSVSQPMVVYTPEPSRWKGVAISTPSGMDAGIAYEAARVKAQKEIKLPVAGWRIGEVELPELTGDLVLTPERAGIGGGLALTDHLDLEAGVSRRWNDGTRESYVGIGWHFAF